MKSMKKVFIGLAAVAAMGFAGLCLLGSKTPEILSENVAALGNNYCAYNPGETCVLYDYIADDFVGDIPSYWKLHQPMPVLT